MNWQHRAERNVTEIGKKTLTKKKEEEQRGKCEIKK
jgi:hypothetical protein